MILGGCDLVGDDNIDMVKIIVHLNVLYPGSMVFLRNLPHLTKKKTLDIRTPYCPALMYREIRYCSRLIS